MKITIKLVLMILLSLNLYGQSLTKQQLSKLNNSVVKVKNDTLIIEEYNSINFSKKIFFDGKNLDKVIVKNYMTMKKGFIHKEQFIAISSSVSDSIIQSIFMNPQYFNEMQSVELLINKPMQVNLTIKIEFLKDGLNTIITNGLREEKRFVPYTEIFLQRFK